MSDLPLTNVRLEVARWLVEHIRVELPTVQVEAGWPGDKMKPETIWVDEIEGDQELPIMLAGRRARDDRFVVPLEIRCAGKDIDASRDRLSAMVAGVEEVMAEAVTLDDDIDGVLSAEISQERAICVRTPEGPRGFARVEISVHVRLY